MQRTLLALILVPFAALSAMALWQHGYIGLFTGQLQSWAGAQVLFDLVIALGLFMVWVWSDARAQGRNPMPWIIVTLALGSFGPLLYLLSRRPAQAGPQAGW